MSKRMLQDFIGWGLLLWVFGYLLGMLLFFVVPTNLIGWIITPIGTILALFILLKKIKPVKLSYYFWLGTIWAVLAILLDYIFIVKMLKPADGYYKFDVYLYYFLTFALPILTGWYKGSSK